MRLTEAYGGRAGIGKTNLRANSELSDFNIPRQIDEESSMPEDSRDEGLPNDARFDHL